MLNVDYVQEIMDDHGWTSGSYPVNPVFPKHSSAVCFVINDTQELKLWKESSEHFQRLTEIAIFLQRLLPISNIFGINQTETAKEKERLITARPGRREIMNRSY